MGWRSVRPANNVSVAATSDPDRDSTSNHAGDPAYVDIETVDVRVPMIDVPDPRSSVVS
jgi:hypothetical protein